MTFLVDRTDGFREVAKEIEMKYKLREVGKQKEGQKMKSGILPRHHESNRPSQTFTNISTSISPLAKEMYSFRKMLDEKTQDYVFATCSYSSMTNEERKEMDETITMFLTQFGSLINQLNNRINSNSDGLKNAVERVHLTRVHEFLQKYLKEMTDYVTVLKREHLKRIQSKNRTLSDRIKDAQKDGYVFVYNKSLDDVAQSPKLNVSAKLVSKLLELKEKHACLQYLPQDENKEELRDFDVICEEPEEMENGWENEDGWDEIKEVPGIEIEKTKAENIVENRKNEENGDSGVRNRKKNAGFLMDEEHEDIRNSFEAWRATQKDDFAHQFQEQTEIMREEYLKNEKDDEIENLEQQISEIQSLSSVFSEKIMDQERDIDIINDLALHTTENLVDGNEWIRKAITNSALRRVILLFCIIVLTFTLLFLDWYNP
ncbi:unnamed protein product [Caenorhabditis angaria]|uniref:t-SNARE coiled-coil homology domain-containing protein n=1 Tax=Caenorhabditis angaria TaxID=860376 RepID=A0A9P1IUS2_9PELO|nr:unnamed protein product [Caenorhabditis angaria]